MLENIILVYEKNFERTVNLINLYKTITPSTKGRRNLYQLDLLRATVVFTHSMLEDFLRSLLVWRLPLLSSDKLVNIPLYPITESSQKTKFGLSDLYRYKDKTVEDIINSSIKEYLDTQSFNSSDDVLKAVLNSGLRKTVDIETQLPILHEMIKRRHNIVHQADREGNIADRHKLKPLSLTQVERWKKSVDKLVLEIVKQL